MPGFFAGALNGMLGGGGGLLLVPLLKRISKVETKAAHATAVAVMMCLSAVSLAVYLFSGELDLSYATPLCIGGAIGGGVGAIFLKKIPVNLLKKGFALFLIWSAWRLWFG